MAEARATTLTGLLADTAGRVPDRIAVAAPARSPVRYAQLRAHVMRSGGALRSLGIERSDRVAVVLPNGPEMALTFLGVAAHAVCAPLNPASTAAELERALTDLGAGVLIAEDGSPAADTARALEIAVVEASTLANGEPPGAEDENLEDVALVLSTSGTTSRPKVVPLTQANLCTSARNVAAHLRLTEADTCLNVMPLFHIHGLVAGLLASLAAGGTVVCTPGFDPARVAGWMEELAPTWYTAVPTMHQAMLAAWSDRPPPPSLRLIRSSSAALPRRTLEELERVFRVPVVESYGMTEAAHQIASNPLPPAVRKPGTVGLAAGPDVAVMGAQGELLAAGATGEIVIRGPNVTSGYADNPTANEVAFSRDGWFRTGDEGTLDEDGYLTITGRLKELINRGGEKVSPREVDEVLVEHPAVAQAVAFAVPHATLGEDVAAAVVLRAGYEATTRELREFAATRLAPFKVPHQVVLLDELPKGPTGKVQRIGLAKTLKLGHVARARASGTKPRTALEAALAGIWALVLDVGHVGVDDDFFELGGDSLRAAELLTAVADTFRVEVPLASLVNEAGTVAGMAALVEQQIGSAGPARFFGVQLEGSRPPLALVDEGPLLVNRLARLLGPDQPVASLLMEPVLRDYARFRRLEAVAAYHVDVLRAIQPRGPYLVGGHSFTGLVAYEMARQLRAQDETVGLVVLLDTVAPAARWLGPKMPARLHVRRARALGIGEGYRHLRWYVRKRRGQPRRGVAGLRRRPLPEWRDHRDLLTIQYRLRALNAPAVLFATRPNIEEVGDRLLGWDGFVTGGLEVHEVPGDHATMKQEPLVDDLARVIAARVERAQLELVGAGAAASP